MSTLTRGYKKHLSINGFQFTFLRRSRVLVAPGKRRTGYWLILFRRRGSRILLVLRVSEP
ncbi:putative non-ribosomal peptide synthetase domain protein [Mycobacterium xenopi 4042]|uniref:Putative non-ribosomal peptide synthetase domain protein n=1 Tax=Mycobacterium xenopi 4042 TaxID=1299334 RepID=X8AQ02_MYCXE|nr:putative non-ribosomal peptide synthetase domain protein [Mycobacterium xenopi 4042]